MNLLDLPVRRPVAVAMLVLGLSVLGLVAWQRLPMELMPALQGDTLFVQFLPEFGLVFSHSRQLDQQHLVDFDVIVEFRRRAGEFLV